MNRGWIELGFVAAATAVAAAWTLNPAVAALPAILYFTSKEGSSCSRSTIG